MAGPQLIKAGVDYLVFDYLAELTMSLLVKAHSKDNQLGYATDFVSGAMQSILTLPQANSVKIISNAGGINPNACALALQKLCEQLGVKRRIAIITGDDLMPHAGQWQTAQVQEMFSGKPLPNKLLSANAYLGALPIAKALDLGADIVITGRCVDSAVTLGALIHQFQWQAQDYDRLAQGSLAGHIIECGCQATGGLFTDWDTVPDWANMGYPILECTPDGAFIVTKPPHTGGLVSVPVIAEQMLYEIGDPSAYQLPDVICDFTPVTMQSVGTNRVLVQGARGYPPSQQYKVSATWMDGWRLDTQLVITGHQAAAKAKRTGDAIIERTRTLFGQMKWEDYQDVHLELIGTEHQYGPHQRGRHSREVLMRLAVRHSQKIALDCLAREIAPAGTSFSPGTTGGGGGGRSRPTPNIRLFSFLWDKSHLSPIISFEGQEISAPLSEPFSPAEKAKSPASPPEDTYQPPTQEASLAVPLRSIAFGRSGDKGNISNIGIIAREKRYLPLISQQLSPKAVSDYFAHLVKGKVTRYWLPGIGAFNFVMEEALGGGGMASLRIDPLGKGMAQMLLDYPIQVPASWGIPSHTDEKE